MFKKKIFLGLVSSANLAVGIMSTSCSKNEEKREDILFEITPFYTHFSNNLLSTKPFVKYRFNWTGGLQLNDQIDVTITKQQSIGDRAGYFVELDNKSIRFDFNPNQNFFDIQVNTIDSFDKEIFETLLSIDIKVIRNDEVLYRQSFEDIFYANSTPAIKEMLDIQNIDGTTTLVGFKNEEWVFQQLSFCNALIVPSNVEAIKSGAFTGKISTDHDWIVRFGESYYNLENDSNLQKIEQNVFKDCSSISGSISIPPKLKIIEENAFANTKVNSISFVQAKNLEELSNFCFANAKLKDEIILPNSLHTISEGVFSQNDIVSISFPEKLLNIGDEVFANCLKLSIIDVSRVDENISSKWTGKNIFQNVNNHLPGHFIMKNIDDETIWRQWLSTEESETTLFDNWVFLTN